jgi:hypothetical protein
MNMPDETPACFPDRKSFVTWWELADIPRIMRDRREKNPMPPYCSDCEKQYRETMKKAGKCHRPKWRTTPVRSAKKVEMVRNIMATGRLTILEMSQLTGMSRSSTSRHMQTIRKEARRDV